jgi:hypothetical protein
MVTPTCPPHPLEAKLPLSYHLGSGRRPEKVHCTELLNTLYLGKPYYSIRSLQILAKKGQTQYRTPIPISIMISYGNS